MMGSFSKFLLRPHIGDCNIRQIARLHFVFRGYHYLIV